MTASGGKTVTVRGGSVRILGIVILIAGLVLFWQYQYIPALISILIGAVFLGKPKKPVSDKTSQDDNPEDGEIVRVDSQLKKVRAVSTEHRRLAFPVDGVAENNDDGSSRQQILRTLCAGEDMAVVEVWLDDFLFYGRLEIRVMTEEGCVGMIRQKDVMTVRGYFGKSVRMIYLEITGSRNPDPGEYSAEVVIIE